MTRRKGRNKQNQRMLRKKANHFSLIRRSTSSKQLAKEEMIRKRNYYRVIKTMKNRRKDS